MQKKSYIELIKKHSKSIIYVTVLMSITVVSVISVVSMRKNLVSSLDDVSQKIFFSNSQTLENVAMTNEEGASILSSNESNDKNKDETSALSNSECKKNEEQQETEKDNSKETNLKEKISYIKFEEKEGIENKKEETTQDNTKDLPLKDELKNEEKTISKPIEGQINNEDKCKDVFMEDKKAFIKPLSGEISSDYSDEKMVYVKTLDEWRVHQGIDILAKEGTNVKAVSDGYVEQIKNDDEYGVTVIVRHSNSVASVYKNLANEILVLPNQIIKQGNVVGLVGKSSKIESEIAPHLHFEMLKNNKLVDPKNYIQFNGK